MQLLHRDAFLVKGAGQISAQDHVQIIFEELNFSVRGGNNVHGVLLSVPGSMPGFLSVFLLCEGINTFYVWPYKSIIYQASSQIPLKVNLSAIFLIWNIL